MDLLGEFKYILKEKGYKLTSQREIILSTIIKNQHKQLTSEEIYNIIMEKWPNIGIATIYRTMHILQEANIVCKFDSDEDGVKYELRDIKEKYHHPHFICKKCGKVFPVKDFDLDLIEKELKKKHDFIVNNYNVKIYGLCPECCKNNKIF